MPAGAELAFPRLDAPAKVDGAWQFAGDIRLPDMVYAAIRHAPRGQNVTLGAHDAGKAKGISGFIRMVEGPRWVAAVASDWWAAERALTAIAPGFVVEKPLESAQITKALDEALGRAMKGEDTERMVAVGDPDGVLGDHPQFSARYDIAPAVHATLETATATARLRDGLVEVWAAVQAPERTRLAIARELAVPAHKVVLYPVSAGGSFDARYDSRFAIEAATLAQTVGKPVQLMWSRWQEHVAGLPRAPLAAHVHARADTAGRVAAWRNRIAMPATMREFGLRMLSGASTSKAARMQDRQDVLAMAGPIRPMPSPMSRWTMPRRRSACPLARCGAARMPCTPLSRKAFWTKSLRPSGMSLCPFAWACWTMIRAWRPVCNAYRHWRNGTGARTAAGRGWPVTGWAILPRADALPPLPPRGAARRASGWTASRPLPTSAASSTPTLPANRSKAG
jgi:hypothetical protein